MQAFFVVSLMTFAFFSEYAYKTWDRVRASAATSPEIVAGKAIPRVAMVVGQLCFLLVVGVVLFDLHIAGNGLALAPTDRVFSVSLVLLGVAVTAVCHSAQQANAFSYAGIVLFGAIGGAMVPLSVLPGWAKTIAPVTPTYWAMRGFQSVILDGQGMAAMLAPIAALAAMSARVRRGRRCASSGSTPTRTCSCTDRRLDAATAARSGRSSRPARPGRARPAVPDRRSTAPTR